MVLVNVLQVSSAAVLAYAVREYFSHQRRVLFLKVVLQRECKHTQKFCPEASLVQCYSGW